MIQAQAAAYLDQLAATPADVLDAKLQRVADLLLGWKSDTHAPWPAEFDEILSKS